MHYILGQKTQNIQFSQHFSLRTKVFRQFTLVDVTIKTHHGVKTILKSDSYSRVHISWNELFFKILKKPSLMQKYEIPHMKAKLIFIEKKLKQNFFFFWKIQQPKTKNQKFHFPALPILNISWPKFQVLVTMAFIWGSVYFCTMDCFFRILKKTLS